MRTANTLTIQIPDQILAICRLSSDSAVPEWISKDRFFSITRTPDELSVVCSEECVPENVVAERNWRLCKVKGPIDFALTGVLSSLTTPLAIAEIPVFVLSTYETDYLLVKTDRMKEAIKILGGFCNIEQNTPDLLLENRDTQELW